MVIAILSIILALTSALFLYLHEVTHQEFMLHLAAIPIEILVGALLIDAYLARQERRRRMQQLSYIKGFLFRTEMKALFINNFRSLANEQMKLQVIRSSTEDELRRMRSEFSEPVYRSNADKDAIIDQYVKTASVFRYFMEWSIQNDVESIFHDMIFLLHFIQDVKVFRELYPEQSVFTGDASDEEMREAVDKVLKGNVFSFLDYAIELRRDRPEEFDHLMEDYISTEARLRRQETIERSAVLARASG